MLTLEQACDEVPHAVQYHLHNMAVKTGHTYEHFVGEYFRTKETHMVMDEKSRRQHLPDEVLVQIMYNQWVDQ